MARRFDKYRAKTGDTIDEAYLNGRFLDIDVRIADVEERSNDWASEARSLRETGLTRVAEAIDPVLDAIGRRASLGAILTAESDSDIEVSEGTKVFVIRAGDRAQFAPAAHLSVWKTADSAVAMLGRTVGYDPVTGELTFLAEAAAGTGFHTGWTVSVANAVDTLTESQIAIARAAEATAAAGIALIKRDEAVDAATAAIGARDVATDARDASLIHRNVTEQARDDALVLMQRYQGAAATNPATRSDGTPLETGDWYLNTASFDGEGDWRWWNGTAWRSRQVPTDSTVASFEGRLGAVTAQDGDYHASEIVLSPTGAIAATRVQAAIAELDAEKQPLDADLSALAALGTAGLLARTGAGTAAARTIVGTANQITVTQGDGVAGNPTIGLAKPSQAEAEAGSDDDKPMTALRTKQAIAAQVPAATDSLAGRVELATLAEGLAGIDTARPPPVNVVKAMLDQLRDQLTAGAGSALDTFAELAAAMANDPNFATTVTNLIATRLPAASVSAFMLTLLDDANAAAARGTLGLGALAALASVATANIDADAVTNAKLANMASGTLKGRATSGTGDPEDLTATQVRTLLGLGALALKSTLATADLDDGAVTFAKLAAGAARERLTAARTYYVRTDGSNGNDGLANTAGRAFATTQRALDVILGTLDLGGYDVTIAVAAGTYTTPIRMASPQVGAGRITILGDPTTPANVLIDSTNSICIQVDSAAARLFVGGVKLQNNGSVALLNARNGGYIETIAKNEFGSCPAGHRILSEYGATIYALAPEIISGTAAGAHLYANTNANLFVQGATWTASGTAAQSAFVTAAGGGGVFAYANTASGTFSGQRYRAEQGGVINTNGGGATYFPGTSAGSATGGYYA